MTAPHMIDPARLLGQALSDASPDLMRHLLGTVINALLSADADAVCGAEYGLASPDRVNSRNGYRRRELDTRVGTIDVAIPKLRAGSYFPEWLLERRKRAEAALVSVVATCYLLGVSTRRMDKLVQSLGITSLSKSQVSRMAADLDAQVTAFRTRPLGDAGPFTFVAADALTMKVRELGRVINAVVLVATGVNADGHREVLGVKVATSETKQAWNVFFADLVARGLSGVALVTSDAHAGLVEAIAANLPGATWQRCRTHWTSKRISWCFDPGRSMMWYAHRRRCSWAVGLEVRGVAAASERASAAVGVGDRGPVVGSWRGPRGGRCGGGERDDGAPGGGRAGLRRAAATGWPVSPGRWWSQAGQRLRRGVGGVAAVVG
jgi:putative transposase